MKSKNTVLQVTFFHRKPSNIYFSIEQLFETVRVQLNDKIQSRVWISPYPSTGLLPRIKMIKEVRKCAGDVNHITGDIHFLAFGLKKNKTILTIHDIGFLNGTNFILKWLLKLFWVTLPVKQVRIITVVSEATKIELLKVTHISPSKIRVIGNFISNKFQMFPKDFNSSTPRILHIGSAPNKNLDRLIEALQNIKCRFIIVGYPSERQIKALQNNQIDYEIHSGLSEQGLIEQYNQCDILSFVSLLEGFGLPILEAQTVGRVIVTSNLSSMPEVAGNGACFVDPYDVISIRTGIQKVINDKSYREQLVQNGFKNIIRYDAKTIANQYYELYREIVFD